MAASSRAGGAGACTAQGSGCPDGVVHTGGVGSVLN